MEYSVSGCLCGNRTAEEEHLASHWRLPGHKGLGVPSYAFPSFVLLSDWVLCRSGLRFTMQLKIILNFWPSSFYLLTVRVTVHLVLGVRSRFNTCYSGSPQTDDCPETLCVPLVLLWAQPFLVILLWPFLNETQISFSLQFAFPTLMFWAAINHF